MESAKHAQSSIRMTPKVIAIGEALVDMLNIGVTGTGEQRYESNVGGAPLNFAATLARYGVPSAIIAMVGRDEHGLRIARTARECGVSDEHVLFTEKACTTMAMVMRNEFGERSFSFVRKPGADMLLDSDMLPREAIKKAGYLHFGSFSLSEEPARTATMDAVAQAKDAGLTLTFDANLRPNIWRTEESAREAIRFGFSHADIVKATREELKFAYCAKWRDAAALLKEDGVMFAFITEGSRGSEIFDLRGAPISLSIEPFTPRYLLDSTGAGDIYFGAAMSEIIKLDKPIGKLLKSDLKRAGDTASVAASLSLGKKGGVNSIPDRATVEEALGEMHRNM